MLACGATDVPGAVESSIVFLDRSIRVPGYLTSWRSSNGGTVAINGIIELHRSLERAPQPRQFLAAGIWRSWLIDALAKLSLIAFDH